VSFLPSGSIKNPLSSPEDETRGHDLAIMLSFIHLLKTV